MKKRLVLGADPAAFSLKMILIDYLKQKGYEVTDIDNGRNDVAFYESARNASRYLLQGNADLGILLCGTGAGMSVVANKYKGVYAVACEGVYSAKMARAINNANVLCMGGWIVGPEMAVEMVKTFLATEWCQDLEDWRAANMHKFAAKVDEIEANIYGA